MQEIEKKVLEFQKLDTLKEAESLTGKSYKKDKGTAWMGMSISFMKSEMMNNLLEHLDDTKMQETAENYLRITQNFGFEIVYQQPIILNTRTETHYILFHKAYGIIINFSTHTWDANSEPNVNGGQMYYNWSPNRFNTELTSSGTYYQNPNELRYLGFFEPDLMTPYVIENYPEATKWDYITPWEEFMILNRPIQEQRNLKLQQALDDGKRVLWVGYHDCREGIITTIKAMLENGVFFPVWHECPFYWLSTLYQREKYLEPNFINDYDLTHKIIGNLPEDAKVCINGTYRKVTHSFFEPLQ